MRVSRRNLLQEIAAGGALAAIPWNLLQAQAQPQTPPNEDQIRSSDFWSTYYDSFTASRRALKEVEPAQGKKIQVYYWDKEGLRDAHRLKKEELLDHPGDVSVDVMLGQFRPGREDFGKIRKYTSTQLRVECVQTRSFLNLLAPATWVALASLFTDQAGRLPSLQQLGFQSPNLMSGANRVVLPGGLGKFSVNVSSMAKESKLHAILRNGVKIGGMLSPFLGLPAISIPAAQTFTSLYSLLEERASFIMSSPLVSAAATQRAVDDPEFPQKYLPLKTGEYVIIPEAHLAPFQARLPDLKLSQGYVIDPALDKGQPLDRIAQEAIPDVTYLSLKMTVRLVDLSLSREEPSDRTGGSPNGPGQQSGTQKSSAGGAKAPSKKK